VGRIQYHNNKKEHQDHDNKEEYLAPTYFKKLAQKFDE
jgi:hypothetical protein